MFTHLNEKIIKKDLHTEYVNELILCHGYKYLSILTDGAFNPDPFYSNKLLHFFVLKKSNRLIPIYGEMRNIPIKGNDEIRYNNVTSNIVGGCIQSGYANIIFYLSNYPNDFMSIKGNIGFQWEDSFQVGAGLSRFYHFGINRMSGTHLSAVPFIPNCFNKLIYLLKESSASAAKELEFMFEDSDIQAITLVTNTLTEVLLPCKRFRIYLLTGLSDIDFDMMLKFEKA